MRDKGRVKFFNAAREFGFIAPDNGGSDLYFHADVIVGGAKVRQGDTVTFDVDQDRQGRPRASNVEVVD
jgi:cold shock protein